MLAHLAGTLARIPPIYINGGKAFPAFYGRESQIPTPPFHHWLHLFAI